MALTDALVMQSPLSIALYDAEGRLAFGNAAYERHFGVRVADVPIGYSLFTDPQLAAAGILPHLRRAYAGEPVVLPPVRYDAAQASEGAGRTVWTEAHCFPLRGEDGVVTHLAMMHLDVTAWAAADAAMRELTASTEAARALAEQQRARLDQILSQLPAAVAVYEGPELRVRAMSAAYQRMIGGRVVLGQPVRTALAELDGQGFFEQMEQVFATGRAASGVDVPARWDADGDGAPEDHTVDFAYSPLTDATGRADGVLALVVDVTDRARSQDAERRAMAAAAESSGRLAALLDALPDAAAMYDAGWRYTYLNPAALALHRELYAMPDAPPRREPALGRVAWEMFPWLAGTAFEVESRRAVAEDRVIEYVDYDARLGRWLETRVIPTAAGAVSITRDVTTQRTIERQREQLIEAERIATERVQRLQHLTALLNRATTTAEIATAVFDGGLAAVGADECALVLVHADDDGTPRELEVVRVDGDSPTVGGPPDRRRVTAGSPISDAVLRREPVFVDAPVSSVASASGQQAHVALPVRAGERVIAALSFSFGTPQRFDDATRSYLATVAEQCALAMERQRVHEAELRVTERHAALLETIQDAFLAIDRSYRMTYVNRRAEELFRRPASTLLGRTVDEAFPESRGSSIRRVIEAALLHGTSSQLEEYSVVARGWVDVRVSPGPDGVTILLQDISARRRAQAATEFMAETSRLLAESLDYEATLRAVADAAVPRLGDWCAIDLTVDPVAQRWPPIIERLAAVHRDREREAPVQAMGPRQALDWSASAGVPFVLRTGQSSLMPEVTDEHLVASATDEAHLAVLRDVGVASTIVAPMIAHGHILGAITLGQAGRDRQYDEHDLHLLEDVAQRAAVAVENARHFRAAERARTEAEEANLAKSQFLATMSHELRTPLNAIAGHVQLIELGLHGPVTDAQRDALARVDRAQRHLLGLINDVLSFARIESGVVEYDLQPVDLADVVRDILPMVEPQLRLQGLTFDVFLEPATGAAPLRVLADREKLGQILLNLISNAIKFTPSGGRVTVELIERANGTGPGDIAFLRVLDTGIGIPDDKLEAIFDPFVQVRRSAYSPGEGGTGLGLAISRDLARGMGGDVRARSRDGDGSAFTVSLPKVQHPVPRAPAPLA